MSWAWSFYLREQSSLYKYKRIMSNYLCFEWSFWSSSSKMSKMSIMLIMLTVITSDLNNQSNHFKTLITQWLFNHCCYIISCKRVLTFENIKMIKIRKWKNIRKYTCDVLEEFNNVNEVIMSKEIDVTTFNDWWNLIIKLCITDINELRSEIIIILLAINMKYEFSFFNIIDKHLDYNDSINDLDLLLKSNCEIADELKTVLTWFVFKIMSLICSHNTSDFTHL